MDDILDLTGGQYTRREVYEDDEEDRRSYSDSLEPSPESEEPSSVGSDPHPPRGALPVIPSAPVEEEHDTPTSPYGPPPPTTTGSVGESDPAHNPHTGALRQRESYMEIGGSLRKANHKGGAFLSPHPKCCTPTMLA